MRDFAFPLDPAETMTVQRVLTPPRVPNKGKAVYRLDPWLVPLLERNGWEFVGDHKRDRSKSYLRSPAGVVADSFAVAATIPTDEPILRLAAEMIKLATRRPGPGDKFYYCGTLGEFHATFYKFGCRMYDAWNFDYPGGEYDRLKDRTPSLSLHLTPIWSVDLHWFDGFGNPPTWDRSEYFSALTVDAMQVVFDQKIRMKGEDAVRQFR